MINDWLVCFLMHATCVCPEVFFLPFIPHQFANYLGKTRHVLLAVIFAVCKTFYSGLHDNKF